VIIAGAALGGLREMARSVERDWASLFFLYGAGRGITIGSLFGLGVIVIIPLVYFVVWFIRLRFSRPPEV
jgi:tetrahydromethanopterin S-methyltransferase subunit G